MKTTLKVTICSYDGKDYFGGPYEWIKRFGPSLRDAGVDVSFLFFSDHKEEESSTCLYLKDKGFQCKVLSNHSFTQYHDNTEDRVRWFLEQVKEDRPDVLIANITLYALFATKWLKQAGIPVIGILHSDDPNHEFMYDVFMQGDPEFVPSAIVAVSELLAQKARVLNPYQTYVTTISCGTPVPPLKASHRKDPFTIVYAGKISEAQKRILETTSILCKVVNELPGTRVEIYGTGDEEETVKQLIVDEGRGQDIFFKGLISSDKIQQVFAEAQAFVLLSNYEGMPVALMEAMAVGLVPVCANIESGVPELIDHEVTGLLVNDRAKEVLPAIQRLQSDPVLWNNLLEQALHKVKTVHSMEAVTRQWIELCEQLTTHASKSLPVEIPTRIILPPVHPSLRSIDARKTSFVHYLFSQVRRGIHYAQRAIKLA